MVPFSWCVVFWSTGDVLGTLARGVKRRKHDRFYNETERGLPWPVFFVSVRSRHSKPDFPSDVRRHVCLYIFF